MSRDFTGPQRNRQTKIKASDSPYARPSPGKSLLSRVKDSVKDLLTPSWLTTLASPAKEQKHPVYPKNQVQNQPPANGENHPNTDGGLLPQRTVTTAMSQTARQDLDVFSNQEQELAIPLAVKVPKSNSSKRARNNSTEGFSSPNFSKKDGLKASTIPRVSSKESISSTQVEPPSYRGSPVPSLSTNTTAEANSAQPQKKQKLILDDSSPNDPGLNRSSLNISSFTKSFSESMNNSSILAAKNLSNSSFYPGKTVYGGISSRRSFQLPAVSPYKRVDSVKKSSRTPNSKTQESSIPASRTANLILKSLAKTGFHQSEEDKKADLFSPALYLHKRNATSKVSSDRKNLFNAASTPPVRTLQTTTSPKFISNNFKPSNPVPTLPAARLPGSDVQVKPLQQTQSFGGKLKRGRENHYTAPAPPVDEQADEMPNLSTSFTLPINTGVKFSFGILPTTSSIGTTSSVTSATEAAVAVSSMEDGRKFEFSSPVSVAPVTRPVTSPTAVSSAFPFRPPASADDSSVKLFAATPQTIKSSSLNASASSFVPSEAANKSLASGFPSLMSNKWKCGDCLVQNDNDKNTCAACGGAKPSDKSSHKAAALEKSPVTNKGQTEASPGSTSGWAHIFAPKDENEWKCDACMVQNKADKDACVACQTKRPSSAPSNGQQPTQSASKLPSLWGNAYKIAAKWKCDACLVQNDSDKDSCVACMSKKPTSTSSNTVSITTASGTTGSSAVSSWSSSLIQQAGNKWKCDTCMVQNDSNKLECVACQCKKPSSAASVGLQAPQPTSKLSSSWENAYKNAAKWKCDACLVQNDLDKDSCAACMSKKPASTSSITVPSTTASGTTGSSVASGWSSKLLQQGANKWKCDTCTVQNDMDKDTCLACQTKRPGEPKPTETPFKSDITGTATAGWGSATSPNTKLTGIWGSAASSSQWKCDACLVSNSADSIVCIACSSAKPGESTQFKDTKSALAVAAQWKCSTCLVTNTASVSLCACCGACKPGTQASLGDITKGSQIPLYGVKFGGPLPTGGSDTSSIAETTGSSVTAKPLSSIFGSTAPLKTESVLTSGGMKISGGFSFGNFTKKPEEQKSESSAVKSVDTSSIVADKTQPTVSTQDCTTPAPAETIKRKTIDTTAGETKTPLFQFGAPSKAPTDNAESSEVPPAKLQFQFGKPSATATESSQPFQVTQTDNKPTSESSSLFGQKLPSATTASQPSAASTASQPSAASSGALFQFGVKPASTQNTGSFSFGAPGSTSSQQRSTADSSAKPLTDSSKSTPFQFGTQQPSTVFQPGKSTSSDPAKPVFQFGTNQTLTQPSADSSKPLFQQAVQEASTNKGTGAPAFSFGTGSKPAAARAAEPTTNLFQFGAAAAPQPSATTPVFQFGAKKDAPQSNTARNSGIFGSSSAAPAFGSGTAASSLFGGAAIPAQPTPSNQGIFSNPGSTVFGSVTAPAPSASTGFQFGASSTTGASFNFGAAASTGPPAANFQSSSSSVFQFGGSKPVLASSIPPSFTSESSQNSDGSNSGATFAVGTNERVIKKATRRIKK